VHALYHDLEARGRFEYVTTRPGRGTHTTPPLWYRVIFPSLLRRYSYVTPRFVLGTFTSDETRQYTMLITQNHWMGLIAADALDSRIVVTTDAPGNADKNHNDLQAVQNKGTAIFRHHNRIMYRGRLKAFVSSGYELTPGASGWLLGVNSDATVYVGMLATSADGAGEQFVVSPVDPQLGRGSWVTPTRKESLLVLEVALASDYPSFAAFRTRVESNRREWRDSNQFDYHGNGGRLTMYRGARVPAVDGKPVDLNSTMPYSSPYLRAADSSPEITIKGIDGRELILDFRYDQERLTPGSPCHRRNHPWGAGGVPGRPNLCRGGRATRGAG
jgi:hypothetical protein